jgi:hypothetical protein
MVPASSICLFEVSNSTPEPFDIHVLCRVLRTGCLLLCTYRAPAASPEPVCAWQRFSSPQPDNPDYVVVFYHNSSTGVSQYEIPSEFEDWEVAHKAWQQQQHQQEQL